MSAPFAVLPLTTATALPLPMLASDFCRLTTICDAGKTLDAGRLPAMVVSESRTAV